ncbi:MAG: Nif3-like dinuclear metal center hexameric protein [Puniceicoccales bacterium]|jgi:dinuclear metal center YbgI/SA1388 family protein|nr:Nif3-like dinuclear metal center hexameric protein [Puniceicoccales bacterium]MDR2371680.1 Nif3-like dinuclear metal center hexameric protein [Puniceicoccales bacterium]
MPTLFSIVKYCNKLLNIYAIEDAEGAYNGLQFQNSGKISKIAMAVDASLETIEKAAAIGANLLVVHHGLFWSQTVPITENIYKKYKLLMDHDIAVYSCHLPLDAHMEIGNNACIAKLLELETPVPAFEYHDVKIGIIGIRLIERHRLKMILEATFPHVIAMEFGPKNLEQIGIISGGSGSLIIQAKNYGTHTLIIGDCQQYHYNIIRENNINVYVCGHYATETFGVEALGKAIAQKFSIPFEFIHTSCPL